MSRIVVPVAWKTFSIEEDYPAITWSCCARLFFQCLLKSSLNNDQYDHYLMILNSKFVLSFKPMDIGLVQGVYGKYLPLMFVHVADGLEADIFSITIIQSSNKTSYQWLNLHFLHAIAVLVNIEWVYILNTPTAFWPII